MEGLHRNHVSEDQRHAGWSEATPGSHWNPWKLEVRMAKNENPIYQPPQPHYLPNWNVLVRGLEQRSVCVASEGEVPLPAEVLPDLDVRCHPRLCGQGHQRGCCQRQNDPPRLRVNNSLTHFFNFDALFVPEKNCRTKILTVEF